jgi:integrase
MAEQLPLRKYVKVWVMRRKNNPRKSGRPPTISYTLQWVLHGKKGVMSAGPGATLAYARRLAADKEKELNDPARASYLKPVTWDDFRAKYLDLYYPGHALEGTARKEAARKWGKSLATMLRERAAMDAFERSALGRDKEAGGKGDNPWCHEIPVTCRETFINGRLKEGSAATAESDLGALRYLFGLMEEWEHRPKDSNPFAGRGKSTVGERRKAKDTEDDEEEADEGYYTLEEVKALLARADEEAKGGDWNRKRLRALVYFVAYTGCRIKEAVHLDWERDVDLAAGIVWLRHKRGNRLKTAASAAPVGLPDALVRVLCEWREDRTCQWVFPNAKGKPWASAGPGYKHLDQLKDLAQRAGIEQATWKMFRHAFSTHGKQRFGMTKEQVRAQLRHTTTDTQKHYDHDDLANLRDAVKGVDFER